MGTPAIRLWILAVAAGCFAAGMVVGSTFTGHVGAAASSALDQDYAQHLTATYGLTPAQQVSLRHVLQHDRAEESAIRGSIEWTQLPQPLQNRLLALRAQTRDRIARLLDAEQRRRFEQDSQPAAGQRGASSDK